MEHLGNQIKAKKELREATEFELSLTDAKTIMDDIGNNIEEYRSYILDSNSTIKKESVAEKWNHESSFSTASGLGYHYVVLQVTLKEKFLGTGSGNLSELEEVINNQREKDINYIPSPLLLLIVQALEEETVYRLR